jgi:PKD repeat protein
MSLLRNAQGTVHTWVKTTVGGFLGIVGGALMTYATVAVDRIIKPAKPVPNYATEVNGLTVTFNNLSQGGQEATWDFGDGSPLEFLPGDHKSTTHTYAKPGRYTIKLSLANSFDQEQNRSTTLEVGVASAAPSPGSTPAILDLKAQAPGMPGQPVYAPATFQFEAAMQNAQTVFWDFGDGRGIVPGDAKEVRTFERSGKYVVKLCVFNGKEKSEKEIYLAVMDPPRNMVSIELQVTDSGNRTSQHEESASQRKQVPAKGPAGTIESTIPARPGYQITNIEHKKSNSRNVQNVKWEIGPNKGGVRVYGQMTGKPGEAATLAEHFVITEEKKGDAVTAQTKLAGVVAAPGQTSLALPGISPEMGKPQRKFAAVVKANDKQVWQGTQLPQGVPVTIGDKTYKLTAVPNGDKVDVRIQ